MFLCKKITTIRIIQLILQTMKRLPMMNLNLDVTRQTYVELISRDKLEGGG
jgi:hypothetical protein